MGFCIVGIAIIVVVGSILGVLSFLREIDVADGGAFGQSFEDAREGVTGSRAPSTGLDPNSPAAKARARILGGGASKPAEAFNRKAYEVLDEDGRVFLSIGSRRIIESPSYGGAEERHCDEAF